MVFGGSFFGDECEKETERGGDGERGRRTDRRTDRDEWDARLLENVLRRKEESLTGD